MRFDSRGDAAGDFVLHAEDVAKSTIVALGPVVPTSRRIHELRANAKPISGAAHATFQHITHAELARDLLHINRAVLVDKGGIAGNDEQPADAGEAGGQVLGDSIGEVFLIGIAADICEGEHRQRGAVWQRQTRFFLRWRASYFLFAHRSDEADALPR